MFYFVNEYLLSSNSSIEHAEIKRLKLFKRNGTPAKLATLDFDPIIHATLNRFGLTDDQLINLYDFFGQMSDYKGHELHAEDLPIAKDYQVDTGNNSRDVTDGDRLVARIYFIGGTIGLVDHVDYYDQAGNVTLRERYDIRGFKAASLFFGQSGEIHNERYYRPDGEVYLEKFYVASTQNTPINSLNILKNYNGQEYHFDTTNEMSTFFLEELDKQNDEQNVFIADRPAVSIPVVAAMKTSNAKKYFTVPFNHVGVGQDPVKAPLNGLLADELTKNANRWDGAIVYTAKQREDLQKRLGKQALPIYKINATPVSHVLKKFPMNQRVKGQMIYVGRLGEDKGTGQLLNIFAKVKKKVPEARLALFGYGSPNDTVRYQKQVHEAGLDSAVVFAGYQPNLEQTYTAQLMIDTSVTDAQPLAIGEALAHGVPVITYNYPYGPAEMVKAGVNGELIPLNDEKKMVKTIIELLSDSSKLQRLSDGAYDNLDSIDNQATWEEWQSFIKDAVKA